MEAFRYAISVGADFLEMDVNVTSDGVPVIVHDPVHNLRFAELPPAIPTLDEVLTLEGAGFNIEMKSDGDPPPEACAELLDNAIRRHGIVNRAMVQSFDFRVLHAMRRRMPGLPLAALVENRADDFVAIVREAEADMIAPESPLVTKSKVEAAHAAGIKVIPWTVNHEADWQRLLEAQVDGIITDDPAALIAWLKMNSK